MTLKADRRLWLDAAGNLAEDGSPEANELLAAGPGAVIPDHLVKRYELRSDRKGKVLQGPPPPRPAPRAKDKDPKGAAKPGSSSRRGSRSSKAKDKDPAPAKDPEPTKPPAGDAASTDTEPVKTEEGGADSGGDARVTD